MIEIQKYLLHVLSLLFVCPLKLLRVCGYFPLNFYAILEKSKHLLKIRHSDKHSGTHL